jgi:hypothetical protein
MGTVPLSYGHKDLQSQKRLGTEDKGTVPIVPWSNTTTQKVHKGRYFLCPYEARLPRLPSPLSATRIFKALHHVCQF